MENLKKDTDTREMKGRKVLLSTLWLFALLNYLYCDVVALMDSHLLQQFMTGTVGNMKMTQGFLLGASVLMEIPIALVLLSRVLPYRANRWTNIIAGMIMTAVQTASLFGTPTLYYRFFSILEIGCTAFIVLIAFIWPKPMNTETGEFK